MKKRITVYLLIALIFSCKSSKLEVSKNVNATALFNGKDLSGWQIHGTEKWYVEEGELVCENGSDQKFGYLQTDKHYKNFELTLEYKQELKGNNGVFVHSKVDGDKASGFQIELAPPGHSACGVHAYERGWLAEPNPIKDSAIKIGDWNILKIQLKGDTITTWLNGIQMVSVTDKEIETSEGAIALQIHWGDHNKMQWRNIRITEY